MPPKIQNINIEIARTRSRVRDSAITVFGTPKAPARCMVVLCIAYMVAADDSRYGVRGSLLVCGADTLSEGRKTEGADNRRPTTLPRGTRHAALCLLRATLDVFVITLTVCHARPGA